MATISSFFDMVYMTITGAPGTSTATLGSALIGFQSAASAGITNGTPVSYRITDGLNWETAHGTINVSGGVYTLVRGIDTIKSSNSNALVNFGSTCAVVIAPTSSDLNFLVSAAGAQSFTNAQKAQALANIMGLALSVQDTSAQTLSSNTWTQAVFPTTNTDAQTAWNSSTNKFTPNVAGLYLVTFSVNVNGGSTTAGMAILKNGTTYGSGSIVAQQIATGMTGGSCAGLASMNGSTDYLACCVYTANTVLGTISSVPALFQAILL